MTKPLISACIITYNQEAYIAECIDGALKQVLDCPYEIVIGEDKSTDGTLAICKEYALKYPNKIRIIERVENIGMNRNWADTIVECKGDYIAICEGDDYWTDTNKLQKQLNVFNENRELVGCFHNAEIDDEITKRKYGFYQKDIVSRGLLVNDWIVKQGGGIYPTPSLMFKNIFQKEEFPEFFLKAKGADHALLLILSKFGKWYFQDEKMAVYRVQDGGVYSGIKKVASKKIDFYLSNIFILKEFNTYSEFAFHNAIKEAISRQLYFTYTKGVKYILKYFNMIFLLNWKDFSELNQVYFNRFYKKMLK